LSTWNVLAPKKFLAKDDWKLLLLASMLSMCCRIREEDFIFKNKLTDIDSMPVSTSNWKNLSTNHKQATTSKSMSVKTFSFLRCFAKSKVVFLWDYFKPKLTSTYQSEGPLLGALN
jgi:hypothetical protein